MQLGAVCHEGARPAAAHGRAVADHRAGAECAVFRAAAEAVLAAGTGCALLQAALPAGEHWVHDDALARLPVACGGTHLGHPSDVLVAERERVSPERLE